MVLLTCDPTFRGFWLIDYLSELMRLDEEQMPPLSVYAHYLGEVEISPVLIPHDCTDGFLCAYWRWPRAYLDAELRKGSSSFFALGDISKALSRLDEDLKSGAWARRYGSVMDLDAMDLGYRLVVAR